MGGPNNNRTNLEGKNKQTNSNHTNAKFGFEIYQRNQNWYKYDIYIYIYKYFDRRTK